MRSATIVTRAPPRSSKVADAGKHSALTLVELLITSEQLSEMPSVHIALGTFASVAAGRGVGLVAVKFATARGEGVGTALLAGEAAGCGVGVGETTFAGASGLPRWFYADPRAKHLSQISLLAHRDGRV